MMRHGTSSASAHYARSKELVARLHQWHFHVLVLLQLPLSYLQHLPGHAKMSAQVLIFHQSAKHLKSKRTPKMVSLRIIMTCATRKVELNVQHLFSHRGDTEGIPRYLGVPTQNCWNFIEFLSSNSSFLSFLSGISGVSKFGLTSAYWIFSGDLLQSNASNDDISPNLETLKRGHSLETVYFLMVFHDLCTSYIKSSFDHILILENPFWLGEIAVWLSNGGSDTLNRWSSSCYRPGLVYHKCSATMRTLHHSQDAEVATLRCRWER